MLEFQDKKSNRKSNRIVIKIAVFLSCLALNLLGIFNSKGIAQVSINTALANTLSNKFSNVNSVGNEFLSNRFTRPEEYTVVTSLFTTQGYEKVSESKVLELWVNFQTTSLRIVDKRSGYVWGDVSTETDAYNEMNEAWKNIAISAVMIEYFDERGISNVLGSGDASVEKKVKRKKQGVTIELKFAPVNISLSVYIYLKDDRLVFELLNKSIKETGTYTLASVVFAPFLGSTIKNEVNGYIFVPDGPGALIRFSKPAHYLNWFEKRVYGKDYSIENLASINDLRSRRPNDFLRDEPSVLIPVFGIVHGVKNNALFGVVMSGKEYSTIVSYPSGILSMYNWASVKFIYRQKYLQPTSRSGAGIQVAQEKMNKFDAKLEISFLTENNADYVGMAKYYREHYLPTLLGKNINNDNQASNQTNAKTSEKYDVPFIITVIASDIEKQVLGYRRLPITKVSEMRNIVSELKKSGLNNVSILIEGWQEGGIHGNKLSNLTFEKNIGGLGELLEFINYSKKFGYNVFFVDNPTKATEKQINLKKEVGINLSQSTIYEDRDNKELWLYRTYYVNINLASAYLREKSEKLSKLGVKNLAVKEYGTKLYGELKYSQEIYRNDALKLVEKTLEKISEKMDKLYLEAPNDYSWRFLDGILEIPMNCSQYLFETDTVPFLQIVLSGTIDYFVPYMNNSFFSRNNVLKTIEYGAFPTFIISQLDNYLLKKTPLLDYPSTKYEDWKNQIVEIYKEINAALKSVRKSKITDRIVLVPGVVIVTYDNGRGIVVNYTEKPYTLDNYTVKPKSWLNIVIDSNFLKALNSHVVVKQKNNSNSSNPLVGVGGQ